MADLLHAMGEQSLSCGPASDSYRLFWLSAFASQPGYEPTMIRLTRGPKAWSIVAVRVALRPTFRVIDRREQTLTLVPSREFVRVVDQFGFWTQPGFEWNRNVMDGASWIVEGRRGNDYHVVLRANEDVDAMRKLAMVFIAAAGISPGYMTQ